MVSTKKRLTISLPERVDEILTQMAREEGSTKVDILRRALALYKILTDPDAKVEITNTRTNDKKELLVVK